MSITPEQAAHELRAAVVDLPSKLMLKPESYGRGAELGFEGMDFYIAGRGGPLGDVSADVVTAAFVFFEREVVRVSWDRTVSVMSRRAAAEAYAGVYAEWAPRVLPEDRDWKTAADLLGRVTDTALVSGAPIFAGWRGLPEPEDLRALVMHRLNGLRELRGALHGAAVLTVGLHPMEAVAVQTPGMLGFYGWPTDHIDTEPLHQRWALAEARTDRMFGRNLTVLTDDERGALVETLGNLAI